MLNPCPFRSGAAQDSQQLARHWPRLCHAGGGAAVHAGVGVRERVGWAGQALGGWLCMGLQQGMQTRAGVDEVEIQHN